MSTMHTPRPEEGWAMPPQPPRSPTAANAPARPTRRPTGLPGAAGAVALALAAMLVGGGIVLAVDRHARATAGAGNAPAAVPGPKGLGSGFGAPGGGPIAGEEPSRARSARPPPP